MYVLFPPSVSDISVSIGFHESVVSMYYAQLNALSLINDSLFQYSVKTYIVDWDRHDEHLRQRTVLGQVFAVVLQQAFCADGSYSPFASRPSNGSDYQTPRSLPLDSDYNQLEKRDP